MCFILKVWFPIIKRRRSEANKVYIYLYTAAKPPAELSEANKVYIYLYTAAKPPAERSEANKVYIYLYTAAKPPAERSETNKVYIFLYTAAKPPAERSEANKKYISIYARRRTRRPSAGRWLFYFCFRLSTYSIPEGSSANPYGEARSAELLAVCRSQRIFKHAKNQKTSSFSFLKRHKITPKDPVLSTKTNPNGHHSVLVWARFAVQLDSREN